MVIQVQKRTVFALAGTVAAAAGAILIVRHQIAAARMETVVTAPALPAAPPPDPGFHSYNRPAPRVASRPKPPVSGDPRNEALYGQLGTLVTPDVLARFKSLLEEKQHALDDALQAARDDGIDPTTARPAIDRVVAEAQAQVEEEIKTALGAPAYAVYQQYESKQAP